MTARHRDDEPDAPDAPTLQLDAIDPSVADAPNGVSLVALLGIQRRAYRQPSRLARIMRTSVVIVIWLGTAAGATAAAWTVRDLLHDDHVTDDVLLPNLDLRPAGTPTTVVAPILPNIALAPSSSSSDGAPATSGPSDVELRAGSTADDGTSAGGGNPSGGGRTTTTSALGGSPSGAPTAGPTTRGSTAPTVGDLGGPDTTTGSSSGPGSGPGNPATTHDGSGNPNPSGPGTTPTTQNNSGPGGGGGGGGGGGSPGGPPTTATPTVGPLITLSGTGGSADVRCTGDTIALLASRPLSGYNAEVQDTGPAKARVRFVSASAPTSKIEAHCAGGSLVRDVVQ